jgi:hypothetical protein
MEEDGRPLVVFDYEDNTGAPLRERLVQQSKDALAVAGRPQYPLVEDLRSLFKARGSDTKITPVWKTCNKYVKIVPLSFDDMQGVIGKNLARELIPSPVPWKRVDGLLAQLEREEAGKDYIKCFWGDVTDAIEGGEDEPYYFIALCHFWQYVNRGLPVGYDLKPKSKELVVIGSRAPF